MQLFDVRSCVCKLRRVVAQFRLNLVCRLFDHLTDQICFATICRFKFLPDCFRSRLEQGQEVFTRDLPVVPTPVAQARYHSPIPRDQRGTTEVGKAGTGVRSRADDHFLVPALHEQSVTPH